MAVKCSDVNNTFSDELFEIIAELPLKIVPKGNVRIEYFPKGGSGSANIENLIRIYSSGGLDSIVADKDNPNYKEVEFDFLAKNLRLKFRGYTIEFMTENASASYQRLASKTA